MQAKNYLTEPKNLEEALGQLDLKGLLVLNGVITQQALKLLLAAEQVKTNLKPKTAL